MSNKPDRQDIHNQLVEKMTMAGLETQNQDSYKPSFDWSFKEEKHSHKSTNRFMRVAAIVIIFLLGANILLLSQPENTAYSDQGILHRLYVGTIGLFTDSEEGINPNDVKTTMTFSESGDLTKAKKKIKTLHIPEYIPEGFKFVEFNAEEFYSGNYMGYYLYNNEQDNIVIIFNYYLDGEITYNDTTHSELIELSDRTIYITFDVIEENYYANVVTDDGTLEISGTNSKEELIKIARNLRQ